MKRILFVIVLLLVVAVLVYFGSGRLAGLRGTQVAGPTVTIEDEEWAELLSWDFASGEYPDGYGWGRRELVDGTLELSDESGDSAAYFVPASHGSDFLLETEVRLVRGSGERDVSVGLTTRDTAETANSSGVVLLAEGNRAFFRHTVKGRDYILGFVKTGQQHDYGDWQLLRIVVNKGRVSGYLNGKRFHRAAARPSNATYYEPHLTVRNGVAQFRNVKVYGAPGAQIATLDTATIRSAAARHAAAAGEAAAAATGAVGHPWWIRLLLYAFYAVILLVCIYTVRHYAFTLNRLFGTQRHPYLDVDAADWPKVTVLVPAHNEEPVIREILEALLACDYPEERLRILPINDRSEDRTAEIIDELAARHPARITPFHRKEGKAGKAAALQDAMELVTDDIVLVFDADYIPGRPLIKQLVAPFFDPETGAVMGRVVPLNVAQNLLTRVLDLERAGGYQVDQQARMNMHLVPQYGGTVGGVRRRALESVGGWRDDSLAEDTDATFRLVLAGWKIAYQNRSECYEQVPNQWGMRMRQVLRWARGHNQAMARYSHRLLFNRRTSLVEKIDGLLLLHVYMMSAVVFAGWVLGLVLWYLGVAKPGLIVILAVISYSTIGNFALFFQIAAAAHLDGSRERIRLLPFTLLGFLVCLVSVTRATLTQILYRPRSEEVLWHKTEHNNRGTTWTKSYPR